MFIILVKLGEFPKKWNHEAKSILVWLHDQMILQIVKN